MRYSVRILGPVAIFFFVNLGALLLCAWALRFGSVDDAFITERYAQNLLARGELAYNAGERVEGYTSFGWVIAEAVLAFLGIPADSAGFALSVTAGAAAAALAGFIVWRKFGGHVLSGLACSLSIALFVPWAAWGVSAMESCGFAFLWTASLFLYSTEDQSHWTLGGIVGALAGLIRPEGPFLLIVVLVETVLFSRNYRRLLRFLAVFCVLFGAYFLWRYRYFGEIFPNTYYAKVDRFSVALAMRGAQYFFGFAIRILPFVVAALLSFRDLRNPLTRSLMIGVIIYSVLGIIAVGGDHFPLYRFCIVLVPSLIVLAWAGVHMNPRVQALIFVLLSIAVSGSFLQEIEDQQEQVQQAVTWRFIGGYLGNTLPPTASVATLAIGAIGYESGLKIIDMYGIVDKNIAHKSMRTGGGLPGHEKFDNQYVLRQRPDVILLDNQLHEKPGTVLIWREAASEMVRMPEFRSNYVFFPMKTEKGYIQPFLRKDHAKKSIE